MSACRIVERLAGRVCGRRARSWAAASTVVAAALAYAFAAAPRVESHPRITTTLLWATDIVPILQRRCFQCHSEQNIAMALTTYREARPWAVAIREETLMRHMPPWSAVAGYGRFANDNSLTQIELDLLVAWADGGAPSGQTLDEEEKPVAPPGAAPGWPHDTPDAVLTPASPATIAAGAPDNVVRYDLPTGFKAPQKVKGIAFKPADRRVVRSATVTEKATGRWLFTWTAWEADMTLPGGAAFTLPAGAVLSVEVATRGTEQEVVDKSELGLYFAGASAPAASVQTIGAAAGQALAPGAAAVRVRSEAMLAEPTTMVAFWPELGAEGQSMELTAMLPDGGVQPILWLKEYRADFRSPLMLADPVTLPKGTKLILTTYLQNPTESAVTVQPRLTYIRVPAVSTSM